MDKNSIKKYAVWARRELISRVSQKALQYGISEKEIVDAAADTVDGHLLSANEKKQRQTLIQKIKAGGKDGFQLAMEEAAYTWFNRFSALRFMEVNGYLPSHVRVFTDEQNDFKPQILAEAIHLELDGLNMEKVYELKDQNKTDELYKYLLITQCNALSAILPGMFTRIADYTELLFPDNLLREGSVIEQMISQIAEDDWKDAVQIIGWLYQYYNAEPKDKVFENLKKNIKITKENIPAATQLFTPDWIVRYMVENSLGRLWVEGHPEHKAQMLPTKEEHRTFLESRSADGKWHYYLEEAEQEPEVQAQLSEIRREYAALKPEEIKVIDPCMGSGHILVYMFDVLVQIYESYGYNAREAAGLILQNNLYGLDIDDRAAQLAYFAVMMKARQYDRRIFSRGIQPHVYAIVESNGISSDILTYFENGNDDLKKAMEIIVRELHDAKEYGSILNVTQVNFAALYARLDEIKEDISLFATAAQSELRPLVEVAEAMAQKYHAVATNPPYMSSSSMTEKLLSFVSNKYEAGKNDLFSVFMERCPQMIKNYGYYSLITQHSWMFLVSFEKIRSELLSHRQISMLHLGAHAFDDISGEVVQTVAFVNSCLPINGYASTYFRLVSMSSSDLKEQAFLKRSNKYVQKAIQFGKLSSKTFMYWASNKVLDLFSEKKMSDVYDIKSGLSTGDNVVFLREWYEINKHHFSIFSQKEREGWIPYNKGGGMHKWYGLNSSVVNWGINGNTIREFGKGVFRNPTYYFLEGITWSGIASSGGSFRYTPKGFIFDSNKGPMIFEKGKESLFFALALLNSKVSQALIGMLNPTLSLQIGDISNIPFATPDKKTATIINEYVKENIFTAKTDWDSYETSWDFKRHPLLPHLSSGSESVFIDKNGTMGSMTHSSTTVECEYLIWADEATKRFVHLKSIEEELNRIFIDIYGLQDELIPEVDEKDVTVRKADLGREIRSLISYAVGCMFGRYSLDCEGLAYAGGEWDASKYTLFPADKDNIIPICDDDYFDDDITGCFIKWIETVYGAASLESNLKFIADALGGKSTPRDVIRSYFLNDFYADHLKIYQKRPIYWLFDSGKKNGFKALIYMHRYQPDTIARMRTDYVHEQQSRYRTAIADLEQRVNSASTGERVKLSKKLETLQAQADEIRTYEEKIHHLADMMIPIDLDDGVKVNYAKFEEVLAKIK